MWAPPGQLFACEGDGARSTCCTSAQVMQVLLLTKGAAVSCTGCCISYISLAVPAFCVASVSWLVVQNRFPFGHAMRSPGSQPVTVCWSSPSTWFPPFQVPELECKCVNTPWEKSPGFMLLHTQVKLERTSNPFSHTPTHPCPHFSLSSRHTLSSFILA